MKQIYDTIIVGGGPAGLSAAIYLSRAKFSVLVIEKEKFGGQITITDEIVNYPGVYKTSGKALTEDDVLIHEDLEDGYSEEDEMFDDEDSDELFDSDALDDDESIYDNLRSVISGK